MTTVRPRLSVAIDTATDLAGVAISEDATLVASVTWQAHQSHSRDLIPTLDWLLGRHGRAKEDIGALFVCLGPGSYAGLRVGLSTAKTLAYALEVPVIGIGRLAADAYFLAAATEGRVVAVQAAGRAELAWAIYQRNADYLTELSPPQLSPAAGLIGHLRPGDRVCGDIDKLTPETLADLTARGVRAVVTPAWRVLAIAQLGSQRLLRGDVDNADSLVPLYLRAPAIGPQS